MIMAMWYSLNCKLDGDKVLMRSSYSLARRKGEANSIQLLRRISIWVHGINHAPCVGDLPDASFSGRARSQVRHSRSCRVRGTCRHLWLVFVSYSSWLEISHSQSACVCKSARTLTAYKTPTIASIVSLYGRLWETSTQRTASVKFGYSVSMA